jgi:YVTN family beta-propeller protein
MASFTWIRTVALLTVSVATLGFTATPAAAAGSATRGFLVDSNERAVVAFDPTTNTITNRLFFSTIPTYAVRPDGREIYVADAIADTVSVVSTATMSIVARIAVRPSPDGIAFTPDSRRAYVSNNGSGSVTVIDTGARRIVKIIPTDQPHDAPAVSPDGARVYVATRVDTQASRRLTIISTATDTVTRAIPFTAENRRLGDLEVSPDGRFVLIENGDLVDTTTNTVVRTISLGSVPFDFVFAPDSTSIYLADFCAAGFTGAVQQVSVITGQILRSLLPGRWPTGVAVSPDGSRLYVTLDTGRAIAELDTPTGRVLDTFGDFRGSVGSQLHDITLSGTAPAAARGERFPPEPPRREPCFP